ncbi:MAG: hypothetical protein AB7E96_00605 [Deferribacterales bacterium]
MKYKRLIFFISLLMLVYALSGAVRYRQHIIIMNSPAHHAGNDIIMVSNDSYRWLRYSGKYTAGTDGLSGFPQQASVPWFRPLLPEMIDFVSSASGLSPEVSSSLLTVFLSGLFIFPLGLFFYLIGYPASGIGAAVTGSLSFIYLSRTTAFQADTDSLNLFFMFLTPLFIRLTDKKLYLFSALAGVSCLLHYYWYFHGVFTFMWLAVLSGYLIYAKRGVRQTVWALLLFLFFSGIFPAFEVLGNLRSFISPETVRSWHQNVDELRVHGFGDTLGLLGAYKYPVLTGLMLCVFLFRRIFLILPVMALGLLVFLRGERFGMYLAPFAGAGIGFLCQYAVRRAGRFAYLLSLSLAFFLCVFLVRPHLDFVPAPYVSSGVYSAVKEAPVAKGSLALCGWNHGFLVEYLKGVRCSSDGATQFKEGSRLTQQAIASVNNVKEPLLGLSAGNDMFIFIFSEDYAVSGGDGLYYFAPCGEDGDCSGIRLGNQVAVGKILFLGRTGQGDNEKREPVFGVLAEDRSGLAVFDNKTTQSLFGKTFIIGSPDISCVKKVYRKFPYTAVYKASYDCLSSHGE